MPNPFTQMELPEDATAEQVQARWREMAKTLHPDAGGDAAKFSAAHKVYLLAMKKAMDPRPCISCNGTGKEFKSRGFSRLAMPCGDCNGTGFQPKKEP